MHYAFMVLSMQTFNKYFYNALFNFLFLSETESFGYLEKDFDQTNDNTDVVLSLKKQLATAEEFIAELENQIKTQEQQINALNIQVQDKEQAIFTMQKDFTDLQTKLQDAGSVHDQALSDYESKLNLNMSNVEKLQKQLEDQRNEMLGLRSDSEGLCKLREELNFVAAENAELKKQLSHSYVEERRLHRSVEEVKSELEQLSSSTMDLMEELQLSQDLQQEQSIELDNLKKVKYIKGDAKKEMGKLRNALAGR